MAGILWKICWRKYLDQPVDRFRIKKSECLDESKIRFFSYPEAHLTRHIQLEVSLC